MPADRRLGVDAKANRILLTGMSGSGKSTLTTELAQRGVWAVDFNTSQWSSWVEADPDDPLLPRSAQNWCWKIDRVSELLASRPDDMLLVSGCSDNMRELADSFNLSIFLTASLDTLLRRVSQRRMAGYVNSETERRQIADPTSTIEPRLRSICQIEIVNDGSLGDVVDQVLDAIRGQSGVRKSGSNKGTGDVG